MRVVICEDNPQQQKVLYTRLKNYAMIYHSGVEIVLVASNAEQVLSFMETNQADCYFLDIELGQGQNGLELAAEIRKKDILASIIFITDYSEAQKLTFKYKVAALDFIIKRTDASFTDQLIDSFESSIQRYEKLGKINSVGFYQVKIGEFIKNIPYENIWYFETSENVHKVRLFEKSGVYEFYGKLKNIEHIHPTFFRCHKSFVVNLQHVIQINKKERYIEMLNGYKCPVSTRALRNIQMRQVETL
ncbi:LytTR family DNA-binding domain-containing protein [Bacillus sp. CGMCC 1.16541]|uniref:LytR/AlgR family response regulator transcription factor n=1 Tax=Bacillus sp. CGMCC 1.16541 TaxID=2185143 RepID=UPI000D7348B0|nr:LytTR family DNA-binding domain-containing protein [Bacillus sp. CGMCC 1.16541]